MRCDPASLPVRAAGPVLAAVHRPRGRTVAAKVAPGVLVEGMAMMDANARAWARGQLAKAIRSGHFADGIPNEWLTADAVLAVLPELLTDERVIEAAYNAAFRAWESGVETTDLRAMTGVALTAAAEALAGVS